MVPVVLGTAGDSGQNMAVAKLAGTISDAVKEVKNGKYEMITVVKP